MKKYEYLISILGEGKNYKSLKDKSRKDFYIREEMAALCFFGVPKLSQIKEIPNSENNYVLLRETFSGKNLGKFGRRDLKDLESRLPGRHIEVKKLSKI